MLKLFTDEWRYCLQLFSLATPLIQKQNAIWPRERLTTAFLATFTIHYLSYQKRFQFYVIREFFYKNICQ